MWAAGLALLLGGPAVVAAPAKPAKPAGPAAEAGYDLKGHGGPVKTVAARSIPGFMSMYKRHAETAPLGRNVTHDEVGQLGLFLLSPMGSGITGEVVYVDAGYHIMGMEPAAPA